MHGQKNIKKSYETDSLLHVLVCIGEIKHFIFSPCGAAAQREPWPPYSRGF